MRTSMILITPNTIASAVERGCLRGTKSSVSVSSDFGFLWAEAFFFFFFTLVSLPDAESTCSTASCEYTMVSEVAGSLLSVILYSYSSVPSSALSAGISLPVSAASEIISASAPESAHSSCKVALISSLPMPSASDILSLSGLLIKSASLH